MCSSNTAKEWRRQGSGTQRLTSSSARQQIFFFFFNHFKSLYRIGYNAVSVLVFWPRGMWDLCSPTRDGTLIPCIVR